MTLSARSIALGGVGYAPRVLALFGLSDVQAIPVQPLVQGTSLSSGTAIRGKRRALRPDPHLERLQKQLEDDMAQLQISATQNQFVAVNKMAAPTLATPTKRTRARRENEFFSLMH